MAQINKPSQHFNTVLYSGNSSTNAITGVGHQPDLVWLKRRTGGVAHHLWHDVVRGKSGNKYYYLESSNTTTQNVQGDADGLSTLDSDGFTLTYNDSGAWNASGSTYVSWNFKAGGTPSSNTDGTITSNVSANTTAGFSILTWTGSGSSNETVGHGLGVAPKMVIIKPTDEASRAWIIWHDGFNDNDAGALFDTGVAANNRFGPNAPTSSVFGLYGGQGNRDGTNFVGYAFAEKKGYSKIGKYTGNGSTDGTFVYTGFKPAWVMMKNNSATANWLVFDSKRDSFNETGDTSQRLEPNNTDQEDNGNSVDFFSNGFKMKNSGVGNNTSGSTYIYLAFAEQPLVGTNNIPATAR